MLRGEKTTYSLVLFRTISLISIIVMHSKWFVLLCEGYDEVCGSKSDMFFFACVWFECVLHMLVLSSPAWVLLLSEARTLSLHGRYDKRQLRT